MLEACGDYLVFLLYQIYIYILLCHSVTVKFLRNRIHCIHLFSPAFILSHCVCVLVSLTNFPCAWHCPCCCLAQVCSMDFLQELQLETWHKHVSTTCCKGRPVSSMFHANICELKRIEPPCATAWAPRVDNDLHTRQLLRPRLVCKTRSLHHSSRRCWAHTCLNGMQQACCNCA